jgi:hypothetical protein
LTFFRVLDHPWIIIAHLAHPGIDLFTRRKSRKGAEIGSKWILLRPRGPQNGAAVLKSELHAIAHPEAKPVAHLDGHGDLAFAADGAGWRHLYLDS